MQPFLESHFWQLLVRASWQAAILIVMILALQWLLGRRLEPRWRHALWLLVVLRLALPWTVPSAISVFNLLNFSNLSKATANLRETHPVSDSPAPLSAQPVTPEAIKAATETSATSVAPASTYVSRLPLVWAVGAFIFTLALGFNHYRFQRKVMGCRPLIDERALNLLEDCKQKMGIRTPVALVESAAVDGPSLFGFLRPRLLLPPGFTRSFSQEELRYVFLHELGHIKRQDIPLGWLMALLQIVHWFNPLVWLAFSRMRVDREMACDAVALSHAGDQEAKPYGRTIIKLLENFGDSLRAPGMAGIVEDKQQMQQRILMIAQFQKPRRSFGVTGLLFIGLALLTLTDARLGYKSSAMAKDNESMATTEEQQQLKKAAEGDKWAAYWLWDSYHRGNNGVQPDAAKAGKWLHEFVQNVWVVRFEPVGDFKPTNPGEFIGRIHEYAHSYSGKKDVGEASFFRTTIQGDKLVASFLSNVPDKLKAKLAKVPGVKVTSVEKMTPEEFVRYEATPQESLSLATTSAPESSAPPKIVATSPAIGATDVNPALTEITVTFDQDMGPGMSWTGGGPEFPPSREGQNAMWRNKRTCVLPVKLEAGHYYRVGINSSSYRNFANQARVPAMPSAIFFTTRGASEELKAKVLAPRIVSLEPENGAQNVNPDLSEVRVTFNVPMGGGFSWCTAGDDYSDFPKGPEGKSAHWTEDKKTCVLPVALKPGMTYRMSLNAPEFKNFQSEAGVPLEPQAYSFTTAKAP